MFRRSVIDVISVECGRAGYFNSYGPKSGTGGKNAGNREWFLNSNSVAVLYYLLGTLVLVPSQSVQPKSRCKYGIARWPEFVLNTFLPSNNKLSTCDTTLFTKIKHLQLLPSKCLDFLRYTNCEEDQVLILDITTSKEELNNPVLHYLVLYYVHLLELENR